MTPLLPVTYGDIVSIFPRSLW